MQLFLALGVLGGLVLVTIFRSLRKSHRLKARAELLGCKPPVVALSEEASGILALLRGIRASRELRFPDYLVEELEGAGRYFGRTVGTIEHTAPFFKTSIFTSDPQNLQAILALKFKDFGLGVERTHNFRPLLGNGIFAANGKQWEHSRALLRPQFVRSQVSDLDLEETHVQNLMTVLDRYKGSDNWTSTVDVQLMFFRLTLDSATEFFFGESANSQIKQRDQVTGSGKGDDGSFAYAFDRAQYTLSISSRLGDNYWLLHTPEFHRMVKRVHDSVDYFVRKAITADKTQADSAGGYVFLRALAQQTQDPVELRSQLLNCLLAGRDTTASLLGWFFYTMAETRYQDIYQNLRRIILDDFGSYSKPRQITFERLKGCQYLQWCISEALRLYPVVPINMRTALVDTTLPVGGGPDGTSPVFIPKGQDVGYSVYLMHRRKDLWGEDAAIFRPDRWASRKPGWDYLPFNGSPRICIGQQFALTEIAYVVVRMVQRIDEIDGSAAGPVKHNLTLTNCPADGVKVRFHFADD